MLYHVIDTFHTVYLRIVMYADTSSFSKQVFVKLTFLIVRRMSLFEKNNPIIWKYLQNEVNEVFWKMFKNKGNVVQEIFLDFADVNSYLTFKIATGKESLQSLRNFFDPIFEMFCKVLPGKASRRTAGTILTGRCVFI